MRIGQVCSRYYPYFGGVPTFVQEISERLASKGFEVEVLTTDPTGVLPKRDSKNGVQITRFRSCAPGDSYYFSGELKKYLAKNSENYDIVHAHSYHDLLSLYAAQAKGKNKLIFSPHYHGVGHTFFRNLLHKPYKFLGRKIFEKADEIICVSDYEKSLVVKNFKVDEKKITIIPHGVNLEEFEDLYKRSKNCRVILYVGRLEKYKGIHYLIQVLPKLDNDIFLEIAGVGNYGRNLLALAKELNVEDRVRFYQNLTRSELLQRYADADVFALLSEHESYGISVAEALASKTPCIVANVAALKSWVDNKNCFGIDYPIKTNELGELIKEVIGKRIGGAHLHDWNETTRKIITVYEK